MSLKAELFLLGTLIAATLTAAQKLEGLDVATLAHWVSLSSLT